MFEFLRRSQSQGVQEEAQRVVDEVARDRERLLAEYRQVAQKNVEQFQKEVRDNGGRPPRRWL